MFDREALETVVELQQKSYRLLQWVRDALGAGTLPFPTVHAAMDAAEAARMWLGRNWESLPRETRPERTELDAFAYLFVSYLQTSFDLIEAPGTRLVSSGRCYCAFCAYLVPGNSLRVRTPDQKAKRKARQMKELYLSGLARETGHAAAYAMIENLLGDPALAEEIAYATYGRELLRRSEFASQGEGVLVLWREIAWDARGKIKKNFVLSAERIGAAERTLAARLAALSELE